MTSDSTNKRSDALTRMMSLTTVLTLLILFLTLYASRFTSELLLIAALTVYVRWVLLGRSHKVWFGVYLAWWLTVLLPIDFAIRSDTSYSIRWEQVIYRKSAEPAEGSYVLYDHASGIITVKWAVVLRLPIRVLFRTPLFSFAKVSCAGTPRGTLRGSGSLACLRPETIRGACGQRDVFPAGALLRTDAKLSSFRSS